MGPCGVAKQEEICGSLLLIHEGIGHLHDIYMRDSCKNGIYFAFSSWQENKCCVRPSALCSRPRQVRGLLSQFHSSFNTCNKTEQPVGIRWGTSSSCQVHFPGIFLNKGCLQPASSGYPTRLHVLFTKQNTKTHTSNFDFQLMQSPEERNGSTVRWKVSAIVDVLTKGFPT